MAFEDKSRADLRKHFEALLAEALKGFARKPVALGEKPPPEFPSTFRAGFKWALITFGILKNSTTELTDEQLRMLCERMHEILNVPPPPNELR